MKKKCMDAVSGRLHTSSAIMMAPAMFASKESRHAAKGTNFQCHEQQEPMTRNGDCPEDVFSMRATPALACKVHWVSCQSVLSERV